MTHTQTEQFNMSKHIKEIDNRLLTRFEYFLSFGMTCTKGTVQLEVIGIVEERPTQAKQYSLQHKLIKKLLILSNMFMKEMYLKKHDNFYHKHISVRLSIILRFHLIPTITVALQRNCHQNGSGIHKKRV